MGNPGLRSQTVDIDIPSYPTGIALVRAQASRIFLALEDKSQLEVGYMFGMDRYYTTEGSMRGAVSQAYNMVLDNPMAYDIPLDKAGYIQAKVDERVKNKPKPENLRAEQALISADIGSMILSTRDLAAGLVRKKLDYLNRNPKALKEEKLKDLGWILGVLFDKGQIIQGAATEHIAFMSSLPETMNPDEALKEILKMREQFNTNK